MNPSIDAEGVTVVVEGNDPAIRLYGHQAAVDFRPGKRWAVCRQAWHSAGRRSLRATVW
jgi:uncharacterized protein (DUF2237 family)